MESHSWIILISIVVLIGCSAFFSASETAISTFNKIRMKKKADDGDKRAKAVLDIWDNYDRTLSTILIGNNLVNILASTLATVVATTVFGVAKGTLVATVSITLLVLLFGEVIPKSYGKEHADSASVSLSAPLGFMLKVFFPLSFVLTKLTGALRENPQSERPPSITEEELIYMMDAIEEEGVLEEQERDLVQSALEFDEISIREIITPRVNLVAIDVESGPDEIKQVIIEEGFSRIPVYEKTIDNIIGVLVARDFLLAIVQDKQINLREMLSDALFVHKGMKLSHLLANFKARKLHLAVVVDEYGGTLGIVTMEDILEELVGDIWDEGDEIPSGFTGIDENRFEVTGVFDLWDMFERLGIDEDSVESDCSTVSGWALQTLEHIPEIGEDFIFGGFRFTVLEMDGHRLKKLGIFRLTPAILSEKETQA